MKTLNSLIIGVTAITCSCLIGYIWKQNNIVSQLASARSNNVDPLTTEQRSAAAKAGISPRQLAPLLTKPLFQFTEAETGLYLKYIQVAEPDLTQRVVHLARKNIGQPYEIYLLGEMPFETYDPKPIYSLAKSDCVTFNEHIYAMALSRDWYGFIRILQRIRYHDGQIGVATRNHYTEADWNPSNRWLVRDITTEIAKGETTRFERKIDRARFFRTRFHLDVPAKVENYRDSFISLDKIDKILPQLQDGDLIDVVRGASEMGVEPGPENGGEIAWVGHTGLVAHNTQGGATIIHSAEPSVREELLTDYIAHSVAISKSPDAKYRLLGFKFLRLESDPLENLLKIDGAEMPRLTIPKGASAPL